MGTLKWYQLYTSILSVDDLALLLTVSGQNIFGCVVQAGCLGYNEDVVDHDVALADMVT